MTTKMKNRPPKRPCPPLKPQNEYEELVVVCDDFALGETTTSLQELLKDIPENVSMDKVFLKIWTEEDVDYNDYNDNPYGHEYTSYQKRFEIHYIKSSSNINYNKEMMDYKKKLSKYEKDFERYTQDKKKYDRDKELQEIALELKILEKEKEKIENRMKKLKGK